MRALFLYKGVCDIPLQIGKKVLHGALWDLEQYDLTADNINIICKNLVHMVRTFTIYFYFIKTEIKNKIRNSIF